MNATVFEMIKLKHRLMDLSTTLVDEIKFSMLDDIIKDLEQFRNEEYQQLHGVE